MYIYGRGKRWFDDFIWAEGDVLNRLRATKAGFYKRLVALDPNKLAPNHGKNQMRGKSGDLLRLISLGGCILHLWYPASG